MRTIKFRCWFANKMFYSIPAIRFTSSGVKQVDLNNEEEIFMGYPDTWTREDDYELMQFTGLYDKNGKEIFESDIVKAKDEMAEVKFEGVVEWFGRLGYFALRIIGDPDEGHLRFSDVVRSELEVLGNKFENPELIGGEND